MRTNPFKSPLLALALLFLVGFSLYAKSVRYEFVSDDHVRIENNPGITSVPSVTQLFDPRRQSTDADLNAHTYRPLLLLDFAWDWHLWNSNPAGYRLKNIAFHCANAFLIYLLGLSVFGLKRIPSFAGALFFLLHPTAVESVVWIVERSNVMCLFLLLLGLFAWRRFQGGGRAAWAVTTAVLFSGALLYRELAVCFPVMVFLLDHEAVSARKAGARYRWPMYGVLMAIDIAYVLGRSVALGRLAQTDFWGSSLATNLSAVLAVWPTYLKMALVPWEMSMSYALVFALSTTEIVTGAFLMVLFVAVIAVTWRRAKAVSLCCALLLLLWLPTSNLLPLSKLFADRFLYPLLVPVAWMVGMWANRPHAGRGTAVSLGAWLFIFAWVTNGYIPTWRSDVTVWAHAVHVNPAAGKNWWYLGRAQHITGALDAAETSYREALRRGLPEPAAAEVFDNLGRVQAGLGKKEDSERSFERAAALK